MMWIPDKSDCRDILDIGIDEAIIRRIIGWQQKMMEHANSDLLMTMEIHGMMTLMNSLKVVAVAFKFPSQLAAPHQKPASHQKHSNVSTWWEPKPGYEPSRPLADSLFGYPKQ